MNTNNGIAGLGIGGSSLNGGKHRVLIADDSEDDRLFLKRAIARHAPLLEVVAEVEDGDEVITYLEGHGRYADRQKYPLPDLLSMDARMPRVSGIEVLEWLRLQNFPSMKIAMLADASAIVFKDEALCLGLDHFYLKSIETRQLTEVVRKLQAELEASPEGCYL
jgi:CheY-like chemotaxis protein